MTTQESILKLVFPEEIFEWFDPVRGIKNEKEIHIIFEEKNIPPVDTKSKKITSKGFKDITITDFPIRGRQTSLTFRRRFWQIEGEHKIIKRDIKLSFPGTKLEKEFADFLKEGSGYRASISCVYSKVTKNIAQGIRKTIQRTSE